jgi:DNA-binding CsgD family transcriptional regulator
MPKGESAEWPLVAREVELRAATQTLDRTGSVLLAGPAGVGKTRLARTAWSARGRKEQKRWLAASASARAIPLGAFASILTPSPAEVADLPGVLAHAHSRLCTQQRLILGVDDAHLLDDVSATLLHQLAAERAIGLIITVRTGAAAPDAVTALWKDDIVARIDVESLTATGTGAVLEAALGAPVAGETVRRLHAATDGNLLWLRHLVAGERAAGRLSTRDGLWAWSDEPELTPALVDLVAAHIGLLRDDVRSVLEILALSQPLPLAVVESLTDPSSVDHAIDSGLVHTTGRWPGGEEARLAHPLYGEVVRAAIGARRARRRRGQIATALACADRDRPDHLLRRAVLRLGSDLVPDAGLLTAAAHLASQRADTVLAIRLLTAACESGGTFKTHLALAFALHWSIRCEDAEKAFASAAALADDADRHRVAAIRAANLAFGLGRVDDAFAVLRDAAGTERPAEIAGARACLSAGVNRLAEAESDARAVLDDPATSGRPVAYAAWAMVLTDGLVGRPERIPRLAQRGRAAAMQSPDMAPMQVIYGYVEALGLWLAGDPDAAQSSVDQLRETVHGPIAAMVVPALDAITALTRGSLRQALALLKEAPTEAAGHGWTVRTQTVLALCHAQSGNPVAARSALDRAEADRRPAMAFLEPLLLHTRAWVEAAEGAMSTALTTVVGAADLAADSTQWAVETLARHAAVCFGDRSQARRLAHLAGIVGGPRVVLTAQHAHALSANDPDGLLRVSGGFENAGLLVPAVDAAAQAALVHRRNDDTTKAREAAIRATALGVACAARTPALRAVQAPSPLSGRQREIATLTARLTNRQIAERLGVSVRTVEGHVYHACLRLDLPNRAALADHISRLDH